MPQKIEGHIVDVVNNRIFEGSISWENDNITSIEEHPVKEKQYILPGLIDAHIHIESSMLVPSEFARIAVKHGTVATVSDPHEIANVMGLKGIEFMLANAAQTPFKFFFGAPSCVPATSFETSGAQINANDIEILLRKKEILYLAEMMNFPGVIYDDAEVHTKLNAAKKLQKPIDGHAPMLSGENLMKYAKAGITTDHECSNLQEALEKISLGMKILIREGSAAKNFDDLWQLAKTHPDMVMLCSDDKHPDDLLKGHIQLLIKRLIDKGIPPIVAIKIATFNPVKHYKLPVGLLQKNDSADFIVIDNFDNFNILKTYINGQLVAEKNKVHLPPIKIEPINHFIAKPLTASDITVEAQNKKIKVIQVEAGQLLTKKLITEPAIKNNQIESDTRRDILKIVVYNRYQPAKPAVAFINGFGLQRGAMASTVAHDSHNIIAVGTNDEDIIFAINKLIESKGGIVFAHKNNDEAMLLSLPVAGLLSIETAESVAQKYEQLNDKALQYGCKIPAPFMTLSFCALLVIPELKLGDKGLFDGNKFCFTTLYED